MIESQLALLRRHGIRPVKRRGQNFLLDGNLARAIAQAAAALGPRVLELGCGGGALTLPLLDLCERVTGVEVDRNLCQVLREQLGGRPSFALLEADLAGLDWPQVLAGAGPRPVVAGNLPYVLTSTVLFALADHQADVAGAVLMIQKEVAERLAASPGSREHGVLAVLLGARYEIALLRTVPATVFWPQPEVASAVVQLRPREAWPAADYAAFTATVKPLFQQRRKQLGTALRRLFALPEADVAAIATAAGFSPTQRPEELTIVAWRQLSGALSRRGLV